ncbi:hypothetical protein Zmor_016070 [Zophobas morio]|uniref:Uncharacterized protein n=1 Tax=Zophobas morio TaxID=2755281 RepID=A0AA38MH68_9CUCU|nr:hypothetical protein Zmor_016070 [Zophobas morio]
MLLPPKTPTNPGKNKNDLKSVENNTSKETTVPESASSLHFSHTCVLQNLLVNPQNLTKSADGSRLVADVSEEELQAHFDNFFEDIFVECEYK